MDGQPRSQKWSPKKRRKRSVNLFVDDGGESKEEGEDIHLIKRIREKERLLLPLSLLHKSLLLLVQRAVGLWND